MNRRTFLKALCAIPVLGSVLARVVPAAPRPYQDPGPPRLFLTLVGGPGDGLVLNRHSAAEEVLLPYVSEHRACKLHTDLEPDWSEPVFSHHVYRRVSESDTSGRVYYRFVPEAAPSALSAS